MGNQQLTMRENLVKEIQTYYKHYLAVQNEVDVRDELFRMTLCEQGTANWNRAHFFFEVIFDALSDSLSISLARLFDKSEKSKSIPALIEKCKMNINLFQHPQDIQAALDSFSQELLNDELLRNAVPTLQERRDKLYAHNDKKYFVEPEKVFQKPLHMYQIWILLEKIEQLLIYLLSELSAEIPKDCKKYKEHNDLNNLFK